MGNCNSSKDDDSGVALKELNNINNKVQVITFAGPEAVVVQSSELFQQPFSDPVFFSTMNKNKELLK